MCVWQGKQHSPRGSVKAPGLTRCRAWQLQLTAQRPASSDKQGGHREQAPTHHVYRGGAASEHRSVQSEEISLLTSSPQVASVQAQMLILIASQQPASHGTSSSGARTRHMLTLSMLHGVMGERRCAWGRSGGHARMRVWVGLTWCHVVGRVSAVKGRIYGGNRVASRLSVRPVRGNVGEVGAMVTGGHSGEGVWWAWVNVGVGSHAASG